MEFVVEKIKEKGKELGMTYTQALAMCFYEEILERICRSEFKEKLWLRMENDKIPNRLVFYAENVSFKCIKEAMDKILKNKNKQNYVMEWDLWFYDTYLENRIEISMDKVNLPFKIVVRPMLEKEAFPTDAVYKSCFDPGKKIDYKKYPADLELAECFYEILDKLELIGGMEAYEKAFEILQKEAVNGRHMCMDFSQLIGRKPIPSAAKRWNTVSGYRNYSYMKKRWKNYFKGKKQEVPPWEKVIELLDSFFTPVWKALEEDEIFFGDWMPHLGRYLD